MPLLKELLISTPDAQIIGDENLNIKSVNYDSREVSPGSAFVCIKGVAHDGHQFAPAAVERGAKVIVAESADLIADIPDNITKVIVPDTRRALAMMAASFTVIRRAKCVWSVLPAPTAKPPSLISWPTCYVKAATKAWASLEPSAPRPKRPTTTRGAPRRNPWICSGFWPTFWTAVSDAVVMEVSSHALAPPARRGLRFRCGYLLPTSPKTISIFMARWKSISLPKNPALHRSGARKRSAQEFRCRFQYR